MNTTPTTLADRMWIMRHAWAAKRRSAIRWPFATFLREAWALLRALKALAAEPLDRLVHAVAAARREIADLSFKGWGTNVRAEEARISRDIAWWQAEIDRRAVALAIAA